MKTKQNLKLKTTLSVMGLLALASVMTLLLTNCAGKSSDPLKDYPVKDGIAANKDLKSDVQEICRQPFQISLSAAGNKNYGQFLEGKASGAQFEVSAYANGIKQSKVTLEDLSDFQIGNEPKLSQPKSGSFAINWTPAPGTIPNGEPGIAMSFKIRASVESGNCQGNITEQPITFIVYRDSSVPRVTAISGLDKVFNEGVALIPFTISIEDPSYRAGDSIPSVSPVAWSRPNPELINTDNGSGRVLEDSKMEGNQLKPSYSHNGKTFVFKKLFDARVLPTALDRKVKPDPTAKSISLCFEVSVLGSNGQPGPRIPKCVEVNYANPAQPAEAAQTDKPTKSKKSEKGS